MVFVLASINPTPPTVMDLQARNTQDLSFASMNSTAVALARQMLAEVVPSPSGPFFLPVTGRETNTPGPLAVMTLKPVFTLFDSFTPTSYYIPPTATRERQDKLPLPATYTPAPTKTLPPRSTNTPTKAIPTTVTSPPVASPTTVKPTETTVPPEPTHTNEPPPTDPPTSPPPPPTDPPAPTSTPGPIEIEPPPTQSTP